jgi:hypothetical protein
MVTHLTRNEFLTDYFDYQPGEHLNVISPTGGGKSVLIGQCLGKVLEEYPELRTVSFMPKIADESTTRWKSTLGLKEIKDWPPRKSLFHPDPPGYVLWPPHDINDETANREHLAGVFKRAINAQYADGNTLTIVDDAYLIGVIYGMNQELDRHWIAGRSNRAGMWTSLQKPSIHRSRQ